MRWQLQEAKQRFSELVRRACDEGPQVVTRHGKDVVVVVASEEYRAGERNGFDDFKAFLTSAPDLGALGIRRSSAPARRVTLEQ